MKRPWWLILLGLVLAGLGLGLWFEPEGRLRGWARGEAFHAGRPTSYWAAQLSSAAPQVQSEAVWELREADEPATEVLTQLLADQANAGNLRIQAAVLLGHLGPRGRAAVPALLEALDQTDPYLKAVAVRSISEIAADDDAVIARLVPLLDGPQRLTTLTALARVRGGGPVVVEALGKLVEESQDPASTAKAVEALGIRKELARPAVGPVSKALTHADPVVRRLAAETLGRISGPDQKVIAALAARLTDTDAGVREHAARSLGWFGPEAKATLPNLRELLDDSDKSVRTRAAQALRRIDPATKP